MVVWKLWIYWISCCGKATRSGPPAWGLGKGLTNHHKKPTWYKVLKKREGMNWIHLAEDGDQWWIRVNRVMKKFHMFYGTWNLIIMFKAACRCKWVPCHHRMVHSQAVDGGDSLSISRASVNILNSSHGQLTKGGFQAQWLGGWLNNFLL